ncbi:MAG: 50S ribosomal protein L17 [Bacteroidetes bacterium]|nr:50S ribosomal protein L17 [Bacteroidota bacterium]
MRHGDKIKNLSRTASHRKALLNNLSCQLIEHKKIVTTLAKAKALRTFVEPLITKAKENTTHRRRLVFSQLQDKVAVKELFDVISPKIASRPGGYTRVIKLGTRAGDNAELAMIELVDYNEIYGNGIGEAESAKKKTRRAGKSKKVSETTETSAKTDGEHSEEPVAKKVSSKAESKQSDADDLTKIEGIGPKSAEVFHNNGITTFVQLSKLSGEELKEMLEKSGGHFNALDTHSWPEQAQLAADGNWDALKELQDRLTAGRE